MNGSYHGPRPFRFPACIHNPKTQKKRSVFLLFRAEAALPGGFELQRVRRVAILEESFFFVIFLNGIFHIDEYVMSSKLTRDTIRMCY